MSSQSESNRPEKTVGGITQKKSHEPCFHGIRDSKRGGRGCGTRTRDPLLPKQITLIPATCLTPESQSFQVLFGFCRRGKISASGRDPGAKKPAGKGGLWEGRGREAGVSQNSSLYRSPSAASARARSSASLRMIAATSSSVSSLRSSRTSRPPSHSRRTSPLPAFTMR